MYFTHCIILHHFGANIEVVSLLKEATIPKICCHNLHVHVFTYKVNLLQHKQGTYSVHSAGETSVIKIIGN